MTWRARAAPVGQSVRAGCGAPMLNVRHHIRMSRSVTPAPPSIAAGFVLLLLMWALQLRGERLPYSRRRLATLARGELANRSPDARPRSASLSLGRGAALGHHPCSGGWARPRCDQPISLPMCTGNTALSRRESCTPLALHTADGLTRLRGMLFFDSRAEIIAKY